MSGKQAGRPKFTPGPWHVEYSEEGYIPRWEVFGSGKDEWVAECGVGGNAENCARLIAAAPEMYAKLAELRDELHCVCRLNAVVGQLGAGIPCTRCELDQLLAKSEGRAVPDSPKGRE